MHYLYQITNLVNGRYYIGVHDGSKADYMGSGVALKAAMRKYGLTNFQKNVLAECETATFAYQLEAAVVTDEFCARTDTYNIKRGGVGGSRKGTGTGRKPGFQISEEQRAAIRGRKHTPEARAKIAARRGWKHTPETLAKMRERAKNRTPEYWQKFKATQTGRKRDGMCGQWLPREQ